MCSIVFNLGAKSMLKHSTFTLSIVSKYDQEIPKSQSVDKPMAHTTIMRHQQDKLQSNKLSLPHKADHNTRMDTKQRTTKHRPITDSQNRSKNKLPVEGT